MKKIYKVLLVEDDFASAKVVTHTLNKYNFFTEHSVNGRLALDKIEAGNSFDLIITDIMMPEMDGLTLVEKLFKRVGDTPIIMLTAVGDRENVRKAAAFDVKMFLLKPISSSKILEKVKEAIKISDDELVNKTAVPFRFRILNSDSPSWKVELTGIPFTEFEELEIELINRIKKSKNLKQIELQVASEVLYNQRSPHHLDTLIRNMKTAFQESLIISLSGDYFKYLDKRIYADMDDLSTCNLTTGGMN